MIRRFFSIMLFLCTSVGITSSNAEEKLPSIDTIGAATASMRENDARQMLDRKFDALIKAFQAGHPDARAKLCELRAVSYDNGNIILVKKIEVHRYRNSYECGEIAEKSPKTPAKAEQAVAAANAARVAAQRQEQERQAIAITEQQLKAKQGWGAAETARIVAEKLKQEILTAAKAEEEKTAAAKATRQAEETLERKRLAAAIAEEERAIAAKAEQERSAAAKAAEELKEKERIKQAQAAAEVARLAAVKQEQERSAAAEAMAKKAAAKVEAERIAAANAVKERLARERAEQVQAAAEAARLAAERLERERTAAVMKKMEKTSVDKSEPKPTVQTQAEINSKPDIIPNLPKSGQQAPGLNVISFSGVRVSPEYYRDSVLIIDFFAPWCQACRRHIPKLVELHNKFRKQGLMVLGLNVDNAGRQAATDFIAELHMTYLIAQADEAIQSQFGIRSVPVVYVVDKKGRITGVFRDINSETGRTIEFLVKKLLTDK